VRLTLHPLFRSVARAVRPYSFVDLTSSPSESRVLLGSGRSGTTWLQEVLTRASNLRPVFEPFNPDVVTDLRTLPYVFYARGDDESLTGSVLDTVSSRVFAGHWRSSWSDQLVRPLKPAIYRGRIVKEIRIAMWAAWLRRRYPETPFAYVIRHPIASASSARKLGWRDRRFEAMVAQDKLMDDHFDSIRDGILSLDTEWERYIAAWCMENIVALRTLGGPDVPLVVYEEARDDNATLAPLFDHFGVDFDNANRFDLASKMSSTARRPGTDPEDDRSARPVLRLFGLADFFAADGTVDGDTLRSTWISGRIGEATT
jgi:hypothetical protein